MFVHSTCISSADYFERRDRPCPRDLENAKYGATYRAAHINRCLAMRNVFRAAGPSVDGAIAHLFLDVEDKAALEELLRNDVYVVGGTWLEVQHRPFVQFTPPAGLIDLCLDGSRIITAVEGTVKATPTVQQALDELRDGGKLAVGGVREGDQLIAWMRTPDATEALSLLASSRVVPSDAKTRQMVWAM